LRVCIFCHEPSRSGTTPTPDKRNDFCPNHAMDGLHIPVVTSSLSSSQSVALFTFTFIYFIIDVIVIHSGKINENKKGKEANNKRGKYRGL
jgi:hypothetical protein